MSGFNQRLSAVGSRRGAKPGRASGGAFVESLELRWMLSVTGAIWTTVSDASVVNGNIYDSQTAVEGNKMTVYLNGGPRKLGAAGLNPNTDFWVRVTDPSGRTVLGSSVLLNKTLHTDAQGELPLTRLWDVVAYYKNGKTGPIVQGFADTPNPGGEYKEIGRAHV